MADHPRHVDLKEVQARYQQARKVTFRPLTRVLLNTDPGARMWAALADIPALCTEIQALRSELIQVRIDRADLLAAARAALVAAQDSENDPLWYLRDELAARGMLPPAPGKASR